MAELDEFSEALMDQLSVEINEEKEISELSKKVNEDPNFNLDFGRLEDLSQSLLPQIRQKVERFLQISVPSNVKLAFPDLVDFKKLKAKKVFVTEDARSYVDELFHAIAFEDRKKLVDLIKKDTTKFLVYSTYAKSYLSKISTTYGDYLDSTIYLNKFILSNYPQIIIYKQGKPFEAKFESVKSGYLGALKMTILEELVHSTQENLQKLNKQAVIEVNSINEELAKIILSLDNKTAASLSEYLQLQPVPNEFPIAKRANLFFMLNPDNFIVNVLGPDVMTFTHVEVDPKISELVPQLLEIYMRWLKPIQSHHAAFTTMEGMAEFSIQNILKDDDDFQNYLTTFMGTSLSSYQVRKSMGREFTQQVYEKFGQNTFKMLIENPPSTRELKEPQIYLKRMNK